MFNSTENEIYLAYVGLLTFIRRINTTAECFGAEKILMFQHFSFYEQLKFHAQLS